MASFETAGLDHVAISVADLERSAQWYRDVLGLERVHEETWGDVPVMMMQSGSGIALFRARGDEVGSPSIRILHAFRVDRGGFDAARRELTGRGLDVKFQDHQVAHSIYFDDPDGHHLELTTYDV